MRELGDQYEERAAQWLQDRGLHVLTRNFQCKTGEIDIIAMDGECLVFIEVRARNNPRYASAAASVDRRKQARLARTAQMYLKAYPDTANLPCRFDVVTFEPRQSADGIDINWIRSAFST
jgi:putative endonuclease